MRTVFSLIIILTALSAYAADYTAGTKCPVAVNAQPADDVAYQAGVDANGFAVAPADATPPALTADNVNQVALPLAIPLSDYADVSNGSFNSNAMELIPGQVDTNTQTGEVLFNQQPISSLEPTLTNPNCW